jgi:hypothetical protein
MYTFNIMETRLLGIKLTSKTRGFWNISELRLGHSSRPSKGRSSRYNDTSVLSNLMTVWNIPRSPSLIGANISRLFVPRSNLLVWSEWTYLEYLCLGVISSRYDGPSRWYQADVTTRRSNKRLGVTTSRTFNNLVMVRQYSEISKSERIYLGYYHLGGWLKYAAVVLECDKDSIPED